MRTLRLTGIGESAVVDLVGVDLLEQPNPRLATYARADSVDLRVSAVTDGGRTARELVEEAIVSLSPRIDAFVFAHDEESWTEALESRLAGRRLATIEHGTGGYLGLLLGAAPFLAHAEIEHDVFVDVATLAADVRARTGTDIGIAAIARESGDDMDVEVAIDMEGQHWQARHSVFRGGDAGRRRSANAAAAELWRRLAD